ncbi:uncharacterized protein LOC6550125 [Drosophila erecta]|uniref:RRM domain-containing protein n=1 Tax=Drosophila erecta TaxID=7220 RepID=B3NUN6_DROER|nr:uncharacterized protein LOC6550125 [Drosophila erecta]EDV46633.1 uncharacterized protein Dere_GG18092 [Drosophila erecta]
MDMELSLDEIIERKRGHGGYRPIDKKFNANYSKPRRLLNKPSFKPSGAGGSLSDPPTKHTFDARNKIIQKARAKIGDARDLINQSMRDSGIDARQLLLDRKKARPAGPVPDDEEESFKSSRHARGTGVHLGRFGQRTISMSNRPGGTIQTKWDTDDELVGLGDHRLAGLRRSFGPRSNQPGKPFAPRGYVDHDNMQDLEDEEITRTLHFGSYTGQQQPPPRYTFGGFDLNRDDDVEMSTAPLKNNIANDPFSIYEVARNRIERPSLPTPLVVGRTDTSEKLFERRHRNKVNTSNLPESLRARLFGGEPDRRVSHGIYANENRGQVVGGGGGGGVGGGAAQSMSHPMTMRRSPPTLPLSTSNSKGGYRLLVSNLHANVTTADIRELFSDIGPMYDAHVVRPGTAEVIYKSLKHAEMAVDAYHHREFDDQPMHCVLVNPHSSLRSSHNASSRTVTTNSSGVEVDIDALHSVLFRDR